MAEASALALSFELKDLFVAYRKAKKEAFSDSNCAHGLKFLNYEKNLTENLDRLRQKLNQPNPDWMSDVDFLGRIACIPKSINPPQNFSQDKSADPMAHCRSTDPWEYWENCCKEEKAIADFRPVIDATVDFMVISALWILHVGHLYDEKLDPRYVRGNRLRRWRPQKEDHNHKLGELNHRSPNLFRQYFTDYGKWRTDGLTAMRQELMAGHRIVAITMDLKSFYHQVDASFLLEESYLEVMNVLLNPKQRKFTAQIIAAFKTWNTESSIQFGCKAVGLPVGLTASGVIANILLHEFDQEVVAELTPSYYARYVDDVFLVFRHPKFFRNSEEVLSWLGNRLSVTKAEFGEPDGPALRVNLPYAIKSELLFVARKQKIFQLDGAYGLDLIGPIEEQIRRHTSEFRDLPHLPENESEMAYRALLVTPDATLEPDALRKADAVTLRRSGFALLLGDVEAYARDLDTKDWKKRRHEFYGLAIRHILVPMAFFDYARYIPRIIGLMAACEDWEKASQFFAQLQKLFGVLAKTCESKSYEVDRNNIEIALDCAKETLGRRMIEAVFATVQENTEPALKVIKNVGRVCNLQVEWTIETLSEQAKQLVLLDWARQSYAMQWLDAVTDAEPSKDVSSNLPNGIFCGVAVEEFRVRARLHQPHWPALIFPTRPIPLGEITTRVPSLLRDGAVFSGVVQSLRGAWLPEDTGLKYVGSGKRNRRPPHLVVPGRHEDTPKVAITSLHISNKEWAGAADGKPVLALERYQRLNGLLNRILADPIRPTYVVFPELALPRRWMIPIANRLLSYGVSLIGGVEYRHDQRKKYRVYNEVFVALKTDFPGYATGLFLLQPKCEPAWPERRYLRDNHKRSLAIPPDLTLRHPVYEHGGFCFGVLVCSELASIGNRCKFQGRVDALFVPEWNQDIDSFSSLVESAALDVHAYIVQVNNRMYGDSRLRAPMKVSYLRDMVRVKGGMSDYYVIGEIDYQSLRGFQSYAAPPTDKSAQYKPFSVGFGRHLSKIRRTTPS